MKQEWKTFYENVLLEQYQLGSINWVTWVNDPIWYWQLFRTKEGGLNGPCWAHPQYRELLDRAMETVDAEARSHLMHQAEALLLDEMPVIPLFSMHGLYVKRSKLRFTML